MIEVGALILSSTKIFGSSCHSLVPFFVRQLKLEFLRDSLISPSHIRDHSVALCVCHLVEASLSLPRSSDLEMPQIVIEHAQQILQRLHQQCIAGNFRLSLTKDRFFILTNSRNKSDVNPYRLRIQL